MCRRYYIEVLGLDPEAGQQQLQQAGIASDAILVVENQEDVISRAIRQVTGVGMDGILEHSRERNAVAARTMYVHFCIIRGDSIGSISARIGRPRGRVFYYANDYDSKLFGDREFKISNDRVEQILLENPSWIPAKYEPPKADAKKGRRRKKRRRKRRKDMQRPVQPSDSLQLKIEW